MIENKYLNSSRPVMSIRLFLVLILFFVTESIVYSAEKYEVSVESSLNIRSAPNAKATVLGTLSDGDSIDVISIKGGWAKFSHNGQNAYINSSYITKITDGNTAKTSEHQYPTILALIVILSIVLYLIRKFVRKDSPLEGNAFFFNYALVAAICILEILYFGILKGDAWFCSPPLVGWTLSIINFFVFMWIIYNQAMLFFNTLEDLQYKTNTVDYRVGYYSYGLGLLLLLACIFFGSEYRYWAIGAIALLQLIQIIMIFKHMAPNWLYASMNALIYTLAVISSILVLKSFLPILIIASVVAVVSLGLSGNSGKRKRQCHTCDSFIDGHCKLWDDNVNPKSSCSKHHFKDEKHLDEVTFNK